MLTVSDHRDAAASRVAQLVEEVDLLDPLAELLLVGGDVIEQLGIGNDDEPPFLRRDADRVDVAEPAEVVQLRVVVVQDVEVREALTFRHEPADRVRDLERRVVGGDRRRRLAGPRLLLQRHYDLRPLGSCRIGAERSVDRSPLQLPYTHQTHPTVPLFPRERFTVAPVDWAVYAALIVAGLAVVAAAAFVVIRSLQAWRDFKRFRRQLGHELDHLADAGERTAAAAERATDSADLSASVGRLQRSLGRLAVFRSALADATGTVTRFTALYPRK